MRLNNIYILLILLTLCVAIPPSQAALTSLEISQQEEKKGVPLPQEAWFKRLERYRKDIIEEYGTDFAFLFNYTQQAILKSSQDKGKSRGAWYWNFEIAQKLWTGGELFVEFEMDRGKGVDKFLPTFSSFNDNSGEDAWFYIPALYLEQGFFNDKFFIAAGKLDLSYWFDWNEVACSADTQFLSSSLVNNLAIPFPAKGIGAMISFNPYAWFYFQLGAATAKASSTKVGLSDAFSSTFFINELGLTPKFGSLQGNYRFIFHMNHQKLDYLDSDNTKNNDYGWALSFDQAVTERITLFLRYGTADPKVRDIEYFWSFGGQIREPLPGRKFDCLGIGVAQSIFGKDFRQANGYDETTRSETMYEVYYSYSLNSALILTPSLQIVTNPNADKSADTEIVCGLRFLLSF
ncbi:MAG: carbohydrate porin [Candidatus Omnitrophica bacterium]|nr:carbohydrate porin [Candidatus Omnitrophota bacterium]